MFAEDQTDRQIKKFKAGGGESNEVMSTQIIAHKFWPEKLYHLYSSPTIIHVTKSEEWDRQGT